MVVLALNATEFIGRFHPILVHLPIGILILAVLFIALSLKEQFSYLKDAIGITLFLGMLSAIASCISGYLLSQSESYDPGLIFKHQGFAIALAATSIVLYVLHLKQKQTTWIAGLMAVLLLITGHLGGSITHGADFLFKGSSAATSRGGQVHKPIANIQDGAAYATLIQPIFESKCIACHGLEKQKAKLRLDDPASILKGGEGGAAIVAGQAEQSNLMNRILLAKDNKDHMPPSEKPQLTKEEIDLVEWWINGGASFDRKVSEIQQTEKIKQVFKNLTSDQSNEEISLVDIPEKSVSKASESAVQKLRERGITVVPVAQNSNYLLVNYVAIEAFSAKDLTLLQAISDQLIWLKLPNISLTDDDVDDLVQLTNLTRLYVQKTNLTDQGIAKLTKLSNLQYLNLSGTKATAKGVASLSILKNLRHLYLYQTTITEDELKKLRMEFPKTNVDGGGYQVPKIEWDTAVSRAPIVK